MSENSQTCYKFIKSDRIGDAISSGRYGDILGVYKGVWLWKDLDGLGSPVIPDTSIYPPRHMTFHRFGKPGPAEVDDNFLALLSWDKTTLEYFVKYGHIKSVEDCRYDEIESLGRRVQPSPPPLPWNGSHDPYAGGSKGRKTRKGRKGRKGRKTRTNRKN